MTSTIRQILTRAAGTFAVLAAGCAILAAAAIMRAPEVTDLHIQKPADVTADLMTEHGCWDGAAPADQAGKYPGGVVVTLPDGRVLYSTDRAMIDTALNQALGKDDAGLKVGGFCR